VSLQDWLNKKQLRAHKTSHNEIHQLMAIHERDIADAQSNTISIDRRFATAYNAALMISVAALAASGFRAADEGHHYWTIQSLAFTLQLDSEMVEKFNRFRRKRNTSDYERSGLISEKEVLEMLELAKSLRTILEEWLRKNHPDLI
jgi:uncharacterized protein (UPF0332 family)